DISGLDDGPITVEATATDAAGNASPAGTATIEKDTGVPAAPVITMPIEGDDVVNAGEQADVLLEGTAEPGAVIDVTFDDGTNPPVTAQVTADSTTGDWTLAGNEADLSGLDDGPITVSATTTDDAGNESTVASETITKDAIAPALTLDGFSDDTGIPGDNLTSDNTPTFSGTAEANATVEVFLEGTSVGTTTANGTGDWTVGYTGFPLADGTYDVTATATDAAGNSTNSDTPLALTIDAGAPIPPIINSPVEGDDIISAAEQADVLVSGTAEADSTVDVTFTDGSSNTVVAQVTTDGAGNWTLTGSEADLTGLDDGPIEVDVTSTDDAGNVSTVANTTVTKDGAAPLAPAVTTPIEGDDFISAFEQADVLLEGTAEPNSMVDVTVTDAAGNTVTAQVPTDGNGDWTLAGSELDLSGLDDGTLAIEAIATDAAGNVSPAGSATVTKDATAPAEPVITTPIEVDDIVNATEQADVLVEGTAEANSLVTVTLTDGTNTVTAQATADGTGAWNLTGSEANITALNDGPITVDVTSTDAVGNESPVVSTTLTKDATAPIEPTFDGPIEGDDLVNASEQADVLIEGTAEPDSVVDVTFTDGDGNTITAQVPTDNAGDWSIAGSEVDISPLSDGPITVAATATDAAGNESPAGNTSFTKDTTTPTSPTFDSPIEGDDIINGVEQTDVLVSGNAEADSVIDVTFSDAAGTTVAAQVTTDSAGLWTLTGSEADLTALDDGPIDVAVTATDAVGNVSPVATTTVTKDATASTAPTIVIPIEGDNVVSADEQTDVLVSGTAEPDSVVEITFTDDAGLSVTAQVTADAAGDWTLLGSEVDITSLNDGIVTIEATATDVAANVSPASSTTVLKDAATPGVPTLVTPIEVDDVVNAAEQVDVLVEGTAEVNSTVEVTFTDAAGNTVTAQTTTDGVGDWTLFGSEADLSGLADGVITVDATSTDDAGNVSTVVSTTVTKDTAAPIAPVVITPIEGDDLINASEQADALLEGTAEPGSVVTVTATDEAGNPVTAQVVADVDGDWSLTGSEIDLSGLDDGPIAIEAIATDAAGNESPAGSATVTKDAVAPVDPVITTPIEGDDVISATEQSDVLIAGTAEPDSVVDVTFTDEASNVLTAQAIADSAGAWSLAGSEVDVSGFVDGSIAIEAIATDAAGNLSSAGSVTVTKDAAAPDAPAITTPIEGDDLISAAEQADVLLEGTAEPDSVVTVTATDAAGNPVTAQVIADVDGNWSLLGSEIDLSGLDDGPIDIEAIATDVAGNPSPAGSATVTKDAADPTAPAITTPIEGDDVVNAAEQTDVLLEGSAEPDSVIDVVFTDAAGETVTAQVTADVTGDWSLTGSEVDITALADGPIDVAVTATDAAGNASSAGSATITKDAAVPTAPVITTPIEGDGVISAAEQADVLLEGTAEPDSVVTVTATDAAGNPVTAQVTTDVDGNWSLLGSEIDLSGLDDGPIDIEAIATDAAGNPSPAGSATVTKDAAAPTAPVITTPIEGDDVVNAAEQADVFLEGSAEPDSVVDVTFTDAAGDTVTAQVTADNAGAWSLTSSGVDISTLADGAIDVEAIATDGAGNLSPASSATITKDATVPTAPVITTPIEGDGTINAAEQADVLLEGTAEPDSVVDVTFTDEAGDTVTAQVTADGTGAWTLTGSEADLSGLADGPIAIEATATDAAGNESPAGSATVTKDGAPPVAPTVDSFSDDTGIVGDDITSDNTPTFSGTAEANATVEVFLDGTSLGTTTADGAGNWSVSYSGFPLADDTYEVTATATDAAGNSTTSATPLALTIDAGEPIPPSVDGPIEGDDIISAAEQADVLVSGSAEADSTIDVTFTDMAGDTVTAQVTTDSNGDWTLSGSEADLSPLLDGAIEVDVTSTDDAGNVSTIANTTVTKDAAAPLAPAITTPIEGDNFISDAEQADVLLEGTAEPNSVVDVTATDEAGNTVTAQVPTDGNGDWTLTGSELDLSGLDDGAITLAATAADPAGNVSPAGSATVTKDATAPTEPTIATPIEGDGIVSAAEQATVLVEGTAEPDSVIDVALSDGTTTVMAQVTADNTGAWSLTGSEANITALNDGPITVDVTSTDAVGNESPVVSTTLTKDATAPVEPTFDGPIEGDDLVNASEQADVLIEGTAEPDSVVDVTFTDGDGNTVTAQVPTDNAGDWSLAGSEVDISPLSDGPIDVAATATDAAGNESPAGSTTFTKDTTTPAVPTFEGLVEGDDVINGVEQADVLLEGTAEPDSVVDVTFTDGAGNTVTAQVPTDNAGDWTLLGNEADLSALDDGPITVEATATDPVGNVSPVATTTVTKDATVPTAPIVVTPIEGDDVIGGAEQADVLIEGTAEPDSVVDVTFTDAAGNTVTEQVTADNAGNWSLIGSEADISPLNDGVVTIEATATDAAGNVSPAGSTTVLKDAATPGVPTIVTPIEGDDAINTAEQADVLVEGTAEVNSTMDVTFTDEAGTTVTAQTVTDGAGDWTLLGSEADLSGLADGVITVDVASTDAAGNVSTVVTTTVTKDTALPLAPTVITPIEGDDLISANEQADALLEGSAEPDSVVAVTATDEAGNTVTAQVPTDDAGNWTLSGSELDLSGLEDGPIAIAATATDEAGNESPAGSATVTKDTAAPDAPVVITPIEGDGVINAAEQADVFLEGTAEPDSVVNVTFTDAAGNTVTAQVPTDDTGNWSLTGNEADISGLDDGPITVDVTSTDDAGNASPLASTTVTKDAATPADPVLNGPIEDDDIINAAEQADVFLEGTAEPDSVVDVTFTDAAGNTVTAQVSTDDTGNWSLTGNEADISGLDDGAITVDVTSTDDAGNVSNVVTTTLTKDGLLPAEPAIAGPIAGDDSVNATEQSAVLVDGTAEPDSVVDVTFTDEVGNTVTAQVPTDDTGAWSLTGNAADISGLDDGPITVEFTATDAAGNESPAGSATITKDAAMPTAPAFVTPIEGDGVINAVEQADVLLEGAAEPDSVIDVVFTDEAGDTVSAQVPTDDTGAWTLTGNEVDISGLDDGAIAITATATDAAGNLSLAGSTTATKDATVPTAPIVLTPIEGDDAVNAAEQTDVFLEGTAEPDSVVDVTFTDAAGDTVMAQVIADDTGAWSLAGSEVDISGLADGPITVESTATDAAGNESPAGSVTISKETDAPTAPTVSGPIEGDDIISAAEQADVLLEGTTEPDSVVDVTFTDAAGDTVTAQATADGTGAWSLSGNEADLSDLADGPIVIETMATDTAGNPSVLASTTVDKDAIAPTVTVAGFSDDTGITGDGITSDNQPTVSGTAEANTTVEAFLNGISIGTAIADDAGTWSISASTLPLADGTYDITAVATDDAGNVSPISTPLAITLDASAPTTPTINDPVEGDNVITAAEQADVLVAGSAEANAVVTVTLSDGNGAPVSAEVTANGNGVWTLLGSEIDATSLADGETTISVTATDVAGNVSAAATKTVVIDAIAPAAPAAPDLDEASDTGLSSTDDLTNDTTPTVTGTDGTPGETVTLYADNAVVGTTVVDDAGIYSVTPDAPLAEGTPQLTVTFTDLAGNESAPSSALPVTIDAAAPIAPTITTPIEGDNIVSAAEQGSVLLSGTAEANATVDIVLTDINNATAVASVTADGNGDWTLLNNEIDATPLADGDVTISATATDEAGNVSAAAATTVTFDSTAPTALTAPALTEDSDTGASAIDNVTNSSTPTLTGTGIPGDTVTLYADDAEVGTTVVDDAGTYSVTPDAPLAEGTPELTVTFTDPAGNPSAPSPALPVTIDETAPNAPAIDDPVEIDNVISEAEQGDVLLSGTAAANSVVDITLTDSNNATIERQIAADENGVWTLAGSEIDVSSLADGDVTISATATDLAGNVSEIAAKTVAIDTTAPTAPAVSALEEASDTGALNNDNITNDTTPTLTGSGTPGETVTLYADDVEVGTAIVDDNGTYSVTPDAPLGEGTPALSVTFTDPNGNESASSPALPVTIDTSAPAAPSIDAPVEGDNV
ncbi:MAG: Ig-like domain-containing protein, partial [Phormidesmis sp.]